MAMGNAQAPRTVTVGTTPTLIAAANAAAIGRLLKNNGAATVFVGGSTVAASGADEGWAIAAGAEYVDGVSVGAIYGIVAAGTASVKVFEVFG